MVIFVKSNYIIAKLIWPLKQYFSFLDSSESIFLQPYSKHPLENPYQAMVYTTGQTHSHSISILFYDFRVFWLAKSTIKSYAYNLSF